MQRTKIGTIAGRHPMPVDRYLLDRVEPGQGAYDAAYRAAMDVDAEWVDLYFTGLTEVTLGAIDGLHAGLVCLHVELWRWDAASGTYKRLSRRDPDRQADWPSDVALEMMFDARRREDGRLPPERQEVEDVFHALGGVLHDPQ